MKKRKAVVVTPYDANWPLIFADIQQILVGQLQGLFLRIEHVGGTSVPGLAAKPIIDLDVIIEDRTYLDKIIPALELLGYWHRGDLGVAGRESFTGISVDAPYVDDRRRWPRHHLYVVDRNNIHLKNHLVFRDFLRSNPQWAQKYGRLKRKLAALYPRDIDAYMEGKDGLIKEMMKLAEPVP